MNASTLKSASKELETRAINGWPMLFITFAIFVGVVAWTVRIILNAVQTDNPSVLWWLIPAALLELLVFIFLFGFFALQPNQARVLILFGDYKGTVRSSGFWWANPFYSRIRSKVPVNPTTVTVKQNSQGHNVTSIVHMTRSTKISLRANNFNSEKLKVNDKRGNPVEIAAVVVWHVEDTAKAAFDVDDYESYVHIQSEAAIRHIASLYAYDRGEEHEPTLRESADEVAAGLKKELQERLDKAGVVIEEARLTHLAYAPEIAQAMLRRQQAEAVIAARQKIVHGAVSMVDMALRDLSEKGVVKLDEERKASMVSNLLVVLCGETEASPVINTGTLYS
jgi:regulator of protease activity HflC (stomatin/prohibitin superfamily)